MKDEWFVEIISQIAETGILQGVSVRLGQNIDDLDFQQIAWFGILDVEGTSERMHAIKIAVRYVAVSVVTLDLRIGRVQRADRDQLPQCDRRYGADGRVPTIVSDVRLIAKRFAPVD